MRWHGLVVISLTHCAANAGGYSGTMARAAECRSSSCSCLACVQAAARARVAGKDGILEAARIGDVAKKKQSFSSGLEVKVVVVRVVRVVMVVVTVGGRLVMVAVDPRRG
jgi:hypothetical protein